MADPTNETNVSETGPVAVFRKLKKPKSVRLREPAQDLRGDEGEDIDDAVATVAKKEKRSLNSFTSKRVSEDKTLKGMVYEATNEMLGNKQDNFVTASNDIDTETGKDARSVWERVKKEKEQKGNTKDNNNADHSNNSNSNSNINDNGVEVYRGKSMYSTGLKSSETYFSGGAAPKGPLRASQSIRVTCRFDYQPDVCKDFKETGYCGYGDACKFMHDRGDYKSGWQLEKEWEDSQTKKRMKLAKAVDDDDQDEPSLEIHDDKEEDLPFACFICRETFTLKANPVRTRCNHYFCEKCALDHAGKTNKCFVCQEPTNGLFNTASAIIQRLQRLELQQKQQHQDGDSDGDGGEGMDRHSNNDYDNDEHNNDGSSDKDDANDDGEKSRKRKLGATANVVTSSGLVISGLETRGAASGWQVVE